MNLMDLVIKIEAADKATDKIKYVTEYTKRSAAKIGKFVLGMTTAFAGVGIALGKVGLTYNSQMENYTTNFKVMLGSAEDAAKKVEELKTMAAKTPFGMQDLADATQTLLAFQVPAENTNEILRMLGDVALGDKNKLSGLALVFGQVSSAGKLQGQDLLQMINQGFNPLNYIAQRTGESMEELRDRMSKGAISAEEVTQAFKDATSEGGQFFNGMQEASKTLSGQLSTLKDNVTALIGKAFEPLSNKLTTKILPDINKFFESLSDGSKSSEEIISEMAQKVPELIAEIIPEVIKTGGTILKSFAMGILNSLPELTRTAMDLIPEFVNGLIIMLPEIITAGVEVVKTLANSISENPDEFVETAIEIITTIAGALIEALPEIILAGASVVLSLTSSILEHLPDIFNIGLDIIHHLVNGAIDAFGDLFGLGEDAVDEIKAGIESKWERLEEWFKNLWNSLFGSLSVSVGIAAYSKNARGTGGHFAGGLDYVPANGFPSILHKGEAVLTRSEAEDWRNGKEKSSGSGVVINQYIQAVAQTPVQFASATEAYFEQARWAI